MPNWCTNYLMVDGNEKDAQRFKKDVKSKEHDLILGSLRPMPKSLENTRSPGDKPNWYDWCIKNWGTKWDVEGELSLDLGYSLEYGFQSAWSPPVAWLKKVSRRYPKLFFRLQYYEENIGFMGIAKVKNGRVDDQDLDTNAEFEKQRKAISESVNSITDSIVNSAIDFCNKLTQYASSLLPERG